MSVQDEQPPINYSYESCPVLQDLFCFECKIKAIRKRSTKQIQETETNFAVYEFVTALDGMSTKSQAYELVAYRHSAPNFGHPLMYPGQNFVLP